MSLPTGSPVVRIGVVIPLYNKEATVWKCIESIASQTAPAAEVIVIDDGSTDASARIAAQALAHFSLPGKLRKQANGGVSSARNAGVDQVACDYVAFLDADDEWAPEFLTRMTSLVEDFPDAALYGCSHSYSYPKPRVIRPNVPVGFRGYLGDFFRASLSGSAANSSKVVVRKPALQAIGGFPKGVAVAEDIYVWMRLASEHLVAFDDFIGARVTYVDDASRHSRDGVPYPLVYYARTGLSALPSSGRWLLRRILLTYCLNSHASGRFDAVAPCLSVTKPIFPVLSRFVALLSVAPPSVATGAFQLARIIQGMVRSASGFRFGAKADSLKRPHLAGNTEVTEGSSKD